MDFSHSIMHTIQHIIKCEQDIMTMMNQMFLFLTIRQLWRSIIKGQQAMSQFDAYEKVRQCEFKEKISQRIPACSLNLNQSLNLCLMLTIFTTLVATDSDKLAKRSL